MLLRPLIALLVALVAALSLAGCTGEDEPDRELATRMCAGCPVRAECLEFELRLGGTETVGVWGALNDEDRRALHAVWSRRRRFLLEAMAEGEER